MIWSILLLLVSALALFPTTSPFALNIACVMAWLTVFMELCVAGVWVVFASGFSRSRSKEIMKARSAIRKQKIRFLAFQASSVFMLGVFLGAFGYVATAVFLLISQMLGLTAIANLRRDTE